MVDIGSLRTCCKTVMSPAIFQGLALPINSTVKMTANRLPLSNMAFDWLAVVLPANQNPCLKICSWLGAILTESFQ